jgi:hypothetical protein
MYDESETRKTFPQIVICDKGKGKAIPVTRVTIRPHFSGHVLIFKG